MILFLSNNKICNKSKKVVKIYFRVNKLFELKIKKINSKLNNYIISKKLTTEPVSLIRPIQLNQPMVVTVLSAYFYLLLKFNFTFLFDVYKEKTSAVVIYHSLVYTEQDQQSFMSNNQIHYKTLFVGHRCCGKF